MPPCEYGYRIEECSSVTVNLPQTGEPEPRNEPMSEAAIRVLNSCLKPIPEENILRDENEDL
jgi:hypothetical protein